ncbi:Thioredoxin-like 3-3 [Linum perenne]
MWIGPMEGDGKNELQGSDLPANRHGNLRRAETDETHLEILRNITSSRSPAVINYGASCCAVKVFDVVPLRQSFANN